MPLLAKAFVVVPVFVVAVFAAWVAPAFFSAHVICKSTSPEYLRKRAAEEARLQRTYDALESGDEKQMPAVRSAVAGLQDLDHWRPRFAKLFERRWEIMTAYEIESARVHALEFSLPDNQEMAFYAELAKKAGHPEEAVWARARMGERGHFRVWEASQMDAFAASQPILRRGGSYERHIESSISDGLFLHPGFRSELATLRRKLLDSTPEQLRVMRDKLRCPSETVDTIKR